MSRKAKLTVFRDKLELISECPSEILNKLDPTDEDFDNISKAEAGDALAIENLALKLYGIYGEDKESNSALYYFLQKGLALGDKVTGEMMLRCIERYGEHFDDLNNAIATLDEAKAEELSDLIKSAKLKMIIASVDSGECTAPLAELQELKSEHEDYVRLYIMAKMRKCGCQDVTDDIEKAAEKLCMASVTALSCFGGDGNPKCQASENEIAAIKRAPVLIDMDEWRDFWLVTAYEYATLYLGGDVSAFAEEMLDAVSARVEYPKKQLHILALKKHFCTENSAEAEESEDMEKLCRFEGFDFDISSEDGRLDVIKEAVYTSGKEERAQSRLRAIIGTEILHERNRYSLVTALANHQKRAARHQWDALLSIKTDSDNLPVIENIPITERRVEISRNGIVLDKEKKVSQVICTGDILIGERAYPAELDLLLDISYVSTTKCTHATIKIERAKLVGEYLVMHASIIIS